MKRVLFAAPNHFGFYKCIIDDFEHYNYKVTSICIEDWPENNKTNNAKNKKTNRYLNKFKSFFKAPTKQKLHKRKTNLSAYLDQFKEDHFDYCLFIRPDYYSLDVIQKATFLSKKSLAYQWDGLDRYPNIKDKISSFNNFLVFDKTDYNKYGPMYSNINLGTNFYFDNDTKTTQKELVDVFYLGAFEPNRNKKMMKIYESLSDLSLKIKITLCQIPLEESIVSEFSNKDIHFSDKIVDYTESLSQAKSSKIILDLLVEEHSGLSFRFFEAMKYKSKIITTNPSVINSEFYHPNNIFIYQNDNLDSLKDFINKPYMELKNTEQYSFIKWFEKHIA